MGNDQVQERVNIEDIDLVIAREKEIAGDDFGELVDLVYRHFGVAVSSAEPPKNETDLKVLVEEYADPNFWEKEVSCQLDGIGYY